jgi:hypothetical protein
MGEALDEVPGESGLSDERRRSLLHERAILYYMTSHPDGAAADYPELLALWRARRVLRRRRLPKFKPCSPGSA